MGSHSETLSLNSWRTYIQLNQSFKGRWKIKAKLVHTDNRTKVCTSEASAMASGSTLILVFLVLYVDSPAGTSIGQRQFAEGVSFTCGNGSFVPCAGAAAAFQGQVVPKTLGACFTPCVLTCSYCETRHSKGGPALICAHGKMAKGSICCLGKGTEMGSGTPSFLQRRARATISVKRGRMIGTVRRKRSDDQGLYGMVTQRAGSDECPAGGELFK